MYNKSEPRKVQIEEGLVEDLSKLRRYRINIVTNQLSSVDKTLKEMVDRGIVQTPVNWYAAVDELRSQLELRVLDLARRMSEPEQIYEDEVEFFVSVAQAAEG